MKCYKIAFQIDNIKHNIGFYLLISIIILFIICLILFNSKYFDLLLIDIKGIASALKQELKNLKNKSKNNNNSGIIETKDSKMLKDKKRKSNQNKTTMEKDNIIKNKIELN